MVNRRYKPRATNHKSRRVGSALILAVVLTSLLAIIGTIFLLSSRVERMATSAISENKELNYAVDSVIALVSQVLVSDVPGVQGAEYYDYPDVNNAWLASLEPYEYPPSGSKDYRWRQISDVYRRFADPNLDAEIIPEYQDSSDVGEGLRADADGDGVADSKWVELGDMTSSKGRPIYAAIRIIDNGGMLNVNTAYKFDATATDPNLIDGLSQTQINLFGLAQRGSSNTIGQLDNERYGSEPHNLNDYIRDVVWRYNEPNGAYTPFDISDELKLRYRYILNYNRVTTRIEDLWNKAYDGGLEMPRTRNSQLTDPNGWFWKTNNSSWDVNEYDYRHIGTTYNIDRIIDPEGGRMVNINDANVSFIYDAIIDANLNIANVEQVAAQIAANIVDYRDSDSDVNTIIVDGVTYYGFEQPCIYISELAHRFYRDPINPIIFYRSYAIELYKPYPEDDDPCDWRIVLDDTTTIDIDSWTGSEQFYVIQDQNPQAPLDVNSGAAIQDEVFDFTDNTEIRLERPLPGGGYVIVDWCVVEPKILNRWLSEDNVPHSIQRDISPHKCIMRLWDTPPLEAYAPALGNINQYDSGDPNVIQAHPANQNFTNIGEIGMVFRKGAYYINPADRDDRIGYGTNKTEEEVRVDLADIGYDNLFQYLTVFDPTSDGINNDGDNDISGNEIIDETALAWTPEFKVAGRLNINTAPWYVIAQLPWVSNHTLNYELARAIVAYRDKLDLSSTGGPNYSGANGRETGTGITGLREEPGFRSIGELNFVIGGSDDNYRIDYYKLDLDDLAEFPDLTTLDHPLGGAPDDFEERDVIFARISNLVTVRSDVFTAYILVRIGTDGPQKRVMAILDRSNVYPGYGNVRVVALHPVPDPR